jgi:predicted aspartyl protease
MMTPLLIVALMLASAAAPVAPPRTTTPFSSEAARARVPDHEAGSEALALTADGAERMTVMVHVGQQGPYAFLVDTGSERTAISRQLANSLKLRSGPMTRVHSVLGSDIVETVQIPELSVGKQDLSVIDAPVFTAEHIGAAGMLGIDSLRAQRVVFDFKAGEMRIAPSRFEEVGMRDRNTIVVRARSRQGRLILTNVVLDGIAIAAIIDTGAQVSIGNLPLMRRLQRARQVAVQRIAIKQRGERAEIQAVTGQVKTVDMARVRRLDLGGVELKDVMVAFASAQIFKELGFAGKPAILLGMDAMRSFDKVSIDFAQKKVRFVLPAVAMRDQYQTAAR